MAKTLKIQYEQNPEYRLQPTHGVWGGVTATGDIVADFYIERPTPPTEVTLELDPPRAREIERVGERQVREVLTGLILRPDVAYAVGEWLRQKAVAAGFTPPKEREQH